MDDELTNPHRKTTMMALRAHQRGGPDQLVYEEAPVPAPNPDEVLVEVRAAAITFDELTWPETWEDKGVDRTPIIPSHEFAGVISQVGSHVTGFAVGDHVFGLVPFNRDGAAAEFVVVGAENIAAIGPQVAFDNAAAAVLPALTAWEALSEEANLAAGEHLLIRGGNGAVGAFLTQFARTMGVETTVTVTSSSAVGRVMALGADHVIVTGHGVPFDERKFDAAIDAVGHDVPEWMYASLRLGGRLIVLQEPPSQELATKYSVSAAFFIVRTRREKLEQLAEMLAQHQVDVAVARVLPLSSGGAAYRKGDQPRSAPGKTVLVTGSAP